MEKKIGKYQIIDHGVDSEQYFPGFGVFGSEYSECYTGSGENAKEALEGALEMASQNDWDVSTIENELSDVSEIDYEEHDELHHYVSIRIKGK